jgi:hypothetical protein
LRLPAFAGTPEMKLVAKIDQDGKRTVGAATS